MTATVAIALLCTCGHAERMHEKDSMTEHDRGACFARNGDCGCCEYRPGVDPTLPAGSPAEPLFRCATVGCRREFTSPQGLTMHRRRAHEGYDPNAKPEQGSQTEAPTAANPPAAAGDLDQLPEAAEQGTSDDRSSAPASQADRDGVLAPVSTATTGEEPAASGGDAPLAAAGPLDSGEHEALLAELHMALDDLVNELAKTRSELQRTRNDLAVAVAEVETAHARIGVLQNETTVSIQARLDFGSAGWVEFRLPHAETPEDTRTLANIVAQFVNAATPFSAQDVRL